MIVQNIRTILGEDLAKQVEAALQGKGKDGKDVDLVVGNDGSFVPADKYSGAQTQASSAEKALQAAAEALKAVGGTGDPAKIAEDVKTAQETIAKLGSDHAQQMEALQKTTALKLALAGQVHDPADIIARLELDSVKMDKNGDLKTDIEELLKPIRETKPYLFVEGKKEESPDLRGAKPAETGADKTGGEPAAGPTIF